MAILHDVDLYGNDTPQGDAIVYYDNEAIKNALTLWLTSKRGEILKSPLDGGVLDASLFKLMTEDNINELIFSIKSGIDNGFIPEIELIGINVTPDYINKMWVIDIQYTEPLTSSPQKLTIYTKDLTQKKSFDYEEVTYTEENLWNWVRIKKADMRGKLLKFNTDRSFWQWGRYLLIGLEATDVYFEMILNFINNNPGV